MGNSHAGSQHSFELVKGSTISEFNHRLIVRGAQRGGTAISSDAGGTVSRFMNDDSLVPKLSITAGEDDLLNRNCRVLVLFTKRNKAKSGNANNLTEMLDRLSQVLPPKTK